MLNDVEMRSEIERIQADESNGLGLWWRKLTRIFIRALRIIFGLFFSGFAVWAGVSSWDGLSTPFAAQSIVGVLGGLLLAAVAWWLIRLAFMTAFGAGPTAEDNFERQRREAACRVNANREERTRHAIQVHDNSVAASHKISHYISQISKHK